IFFFFQAEDGIRDDLVTGVQTCALPISTNISSGMRPSVRTGGNGFVMDFFSLRKTTACPAAPAMTRRPPSGAAVNPKRGPFSAEPLNIHSDEVAVVLEFLAMDNFSADASFILQGSELH